MKFKVQADVFEVLPDACFGVVVARGINNRQEDGYIASLFESSIVNLRERVQNINLKEFPPIAA